MGLKICSKAAEDGLHKIDMVVQTVDLCDFISIGESGKFGINVFCDKDIGDYSKNYAYNAAKSFFKFVNLSSNSKKEAGVDIKIKKNIPLNSGLGGGSSDAAAVIVGLNEIFRTGLTINDFIKISKDIGSDVPLFFTGGTLRVGGTGEIIKKISDIKDCSILVLKPGFDVETKKAYEIYDSKISENSKYDNRIDILLNSIESNDIETLFRCTFNDFEKVISCNEISFRLTGSGSAMYHIFPTKFQAKKVFEKMKNLKKEVFLCKPTNYGVKIIENSWN